MSTSRRTYVVLKQNENGCWEEHETAAYNAETAITNVANTEAGGEGQYAAIVGSYFVRRAVGNRMMFGILPEDEAAPTALSAVADGSQS